MNYKNGGSVLEFEGDEPRNLPSGFRWHEVSSIEDLSAGRSVYLRGELIERISDAYKDIFNAVHVLTQHGVEFTPEQLMAIDAIFQREHE
jgi:hypothetical protein